MVVVVVVVVMVESERGGVVGEGEGCVGRNKRGREGQQGQGEATGSV